MNDGGYMIVEKYRESSKMARSVWAGKEDNSEKGTLLLKEIFDGKKIFDFPKSMEMIKKIIEMGTLKQDIILDFFAGSGTTGQAVMQLNAEDEGNRRFILCQIDEPIKEDKPAYKFCTDNNLPPVISSITVERLRRAGEKIEKEAEERQKEKKGQLNFENQTNKKNYSSDFGFKVFDLTDAPKLEIADDGQIVMQNTDADPLSRIFNIIFAVGIDDPNDTLECLLPDCLYKIGNNHYITNAQQLDKPENKHLLTEAIKNGKVYIDGWTASLNTTLQNFKEDVKIVF